MDDPALALEGRDQPVRATWLLERLELCRRLADRELGRRLAWMLRLDGFKYRGYRGVADYAEQELDRWLAWASRSRLGPFVKAARTVRKYKDGILAYIETKLTNGLVEGFNNKLRMIARRAFGFHSAGALIGMLFLCCGGVAVNPPLPTSWCTW